MRAESRNGLQLPYGYLAELQRFTRRGLKSTVDQGAMTRCFGRRSQTLLCQRVLLLARVQPRWRYIDGAPLGLSS